MRMSRRLQSLPRAKRRRHYITESKLFIFLSSGFYYLGDSPGISIGQKIDFFCLIISSTRSRHLSLGNTINSYLSCDHALPICYLTVCLLREEKKKKKKKKTSDRSLTVHLGIILSNNRSRVSYSFRFIFMHLRLILNLLVRHYR